jgi:glutaredoxin-like protein NrdH
MTIVYAKPACPQCDATCRQLDKCELKYQKIDITQDPEAYQRVQALGYQAAPVVVAGEQHWSGFRPDRINALVA